MVAILAKKENIQEVPGYHCQKQFVICHLSSSTFCTGNSCVLPLHSHCKAKSYPLVLCVYVLYNIHPKCVINDPKYFNHSSGKATKRVTVRMDTPACVRMPHITNRAQEGTKGSSCFFFAVGLEGLFFTTSLYNFNCSLKGLFQITLEIVHQKCLLCSLRHSRRCHESLGSVPQGSRGLGFPFEFKYKFEKVFVLKLSCEYL